jgi:hypothetical protein
MFARDNAQVVRAHVFKTLLLRINRSHIIILLCALHEFRPDGMQILFIIVIYIFICIMSLVYQTVIQLLVNHYLHYVFLALTTAEIPVHIVICERVYTF